MIRRTACAVVVVLVVACIAPAAEKELHVVAVSAGHQAVRDRSTPGTASITVDRPGKEVVLVVQASSPVVWEVRATAKTKLTKVLAVGDNRQTVVAPNGVEVEELTRDSKKDGASTDDIRGHHVIESAQFRPFVQKLFAHTKMEIASFQGASRFDPAKPFVVNAVQNDERLSSEFPKLTPAAQLPKFQFDATRIVFGDEKSEHIASLGKWTETGPAVNGFTPLPKRVRQIAYDTRAEQHYCIDDHELYLLGGQVRAATKVEHPKGFSWPSALTYDGKSDRLVILTRGGVFAYSATAPVPWKQLVEKAFLPYAAVAWQAKTDTLYAFGIERDANNAERLVPTLYELNGLGAEVNKTVLGSPLFPMLGDSPLSRRAELIDLGAELALLIHNENRDSGTGERGKPEAFLYVIDPKTGKTKLAWKE